MIGGQNAAQKFSDRCQLPTLMNWGQGYCTLYKINLENYDDYNEFQLVILSLSSWWWSYHKCVQCENNEDHDYHSCKMTRSHSTGMIMFFCQYYYDNDNVYDDDNDLIIL